MSYFVAGDNNKSTKKVQLLQYEVLQKAGVSVILVSCEKDCLLSFPKILFLFNNQKKKKLFALVHRSSGLRNKYYMVSKILFFDL